jgi:PhnB protein
MKTFNTYLNFDGNCAQAMEFYKKCLGAELFMMRFSEAPAEMDCTPPPGVTMDKNRILHASLSSNGNMLLMASDTMPGMPFHQGNNFTISIPCASAEEVDRYFNALGEKGKPVMPPQQTFWAKRFGMLTDQFGINWMFNFEK